MTGLSVLLFDEDAAERKRTVSVLQTSGVAEDVCAAESSSSALAALEQQSFDVVLVQCPSPSPGALAFLEHVRAFRPTTPTLVATHALSNGKPHWSIENVAVDVPLTPQLKRLAEAVEQSFAPPLSDSAPQSDENLHQRILDRLPEIVWATDADGAVCYVNPEWFRYTGQTPAQNVVPEWEAVLHPDDFLTYETARKAAAESCAPYEVECRVFHASSNAFRICLLRLTPDFDPTARAVRWFGIASEVEQLVRATNALHRAHEDLAQFSYSASHDLQEPLRAIASYSQLLSRRYQGKIDQDADDFIGYIVTSVRRMSALIQDLLVYSRQTSSARSNPAWIEASVALDIALAKLEPQITKSGASVTFEKLPVIFADLGQFAALFASLIENAIFFRRPGVPSVIHISVRRDGDEYLFSISDNGCGFDPRYNDRIFGLFKRLRNDHESGTGIGLAVAKAIVERYEGRIWAESEPGLGSTFNFTCPARTPPQSC